MYKSEIICPKSAFYQMTELGLEAKCSDLNHIVHTAQQKVSATEHRTASHGFSPTAPNFNFFILKSESTDQEKFLFYIMTFKIWKTAITSALSSLVSDQNSQLLSFFLKRTVYVKAVRIPMLALLV